MRFQDVIPNYFTALFSRMITTKAILDWSDDVDWAKVIEDNDAGLDKYINSPSVALPEDRENVDYFADDRGFNEIWTAAQLQFGDYE
jgi:hypothetical protein